MTKRRNQAKKSFWNNFLGLILKPEKKKSFVKKGTKKQTKGKAKKGTKKQTKGKAKKGTKKQTKGKAKEGTKKQIKKRNKKRVVRKKNLALNRYYNNPIISPISYNYWEAWQTFNPGVILLNNSVHFLYRAIGHDGISRFGYAFSNDGFEINQRLPYPIYEHRMTTSEVNYYSFASGGSFGGAEDARIVRVSNEDRLYMTYTACDRGLRVAITSIKVKDFLDKNWKWTRPVLISPYGQLHKNWVIFPEKINGKYAILHSISPRILIEYRDNLDFKRGETIKSKYDGNNPDKSCWDKWVRGAGAPPVKTKNGWLLFYHAMDKDMSKYKVGAMLMDLNDPTKIISRAKEPVIEPKSDYENNGFKSGIVYVSGVIVKNGNLFVYYGAADTYVSVATVRLDKFLSGLVNKKTPKLRMRYSKPLIDKTI